MQDKTQTIKFVFNKDIDQKSHNKEKKTDKQTRKAEIRDARHKRKKDNKKKKNQNANE